MNQTSQEIIVQPDSLRQFASTLYQKAGVSQEHAELMAELQVETDLRNVHSHGTRMLPSYVRSMLNGDMNPTPEICVVREGPGFAVIDGDNGLGHPSSALGMKMAIEKAKSAGIDTVAFDRSGFRYHGRVKALADAAREAGLKF